MTRFQYVSVPRRRNPVIVAYTARDTNGEIEIAIGASFCSNRDRFNRRLGRQIAEGRLLHGEPVTFYGRMVDGESFNQAVVREINQYVSGRFSDVMARFCQR
jgi:hypothetical protein